MLFELVDCSLFILSLLLLFLHFCLDRWFAGNTNLVYSLTRSPFINSFDHHHQYTRWILDFEPTSCSEPFGAGKNRYYNNHCNECAVVWCKHVQQTVVYGGDEEIQPTTYNKLFSECLFCVLQRDYWNGARWSRRFAEKCFTLRI